MNDKQKTDELMNVLRETWAYLIGTPAQFTAANMPKAAQGAADVAERVRLAIKRHDTPADDIRIEL